MYLESMNYSKNKSRFLLIGLLVALMAFTMECGVVKPPAYGDVKKIVVLADDADWNYAEDALRAVYERIIETPQPEKRFTVTHPPLENFNLYKKYPNIILMGTTKSDGVIGDLLNNSITPENRADIESGEKYAFQQRDVWARNQYMLILVAPTIQDLVNKINNNSDRLFQLVNNEANNFLMRSMYKRAEQVKISEQLFQKYGFSIRVQHDYKMKEWQEHNAVLFHRYDPDRLILIHWVDTTGVIYIPEFWAIQKRDELSNKLFAGRVAIPESITRKRTELAGYHAVEFRGLWWHPDGIVGGGPMINYAFFDEYTDRIYMIDLAVYAPEFVGEKEPLIRQLEVIASTFTTQQRK